MPTRVPGAGAAPAPVHPGTRRVPPPVLFPRSTFTAYHVGAVLFVLIERWLPDVISLRRARRGAARRGGVADHRAAVLFLWMNRLIVRGFAREPEQRGSAWRKWLTYVTLFPRGRWC